MSLKTEILKKDKRIHSKDGQYHIDDKYMLDSKKKPHHQEVVKRFKSGLKDHMDLLNDEEEAPLSILLIELSHSSTVCMETITFLHNLIVSIDESYSVYLTYEYNYLGYDFSCIIENSTASFCIKDEISKKEFGLL